MNANSNNPFLNPKPTSPAFQAPHTAPIRPSGTNPFLASFEQDLRSNSPHIRNDMQQATNTGQAPAIGDDAKELFVSRSSHVLQQASLAVTLEVIFAVSISTSAIPMALPVSLSSIRDSNPILAQKRLTVTDDITQGQ